MGEMSLVSFTPGKSKQWCVSSSVLPPGPEEPSWGPTQGGRRCSLAPGCLKVAVHPSESLLVANEKLPCILLRIPSSLGPFCKLLNCPFSCGEQQEREGHGLPPQPVTLGQGRHAGLGWARSLAGLTQEPAPAASGLHFRPGRAIWATWKQSEWRWSWAGTHTGYKGRPATSQARPMELLMSRTC